MRGTPVWSRLDGSVVRRGQPVDVEWEGWPTWTERLVAGALAGYAAGSR